MRNRSAKITAASCLALATCGLVPVMAGDPSDGLQFMLDFRSGESNITAKSVGNALCFSGASASVASLAGGATASNKVHQVPVKCVPPMYPWQTNDVYALSLPQHTRYEEVGGVSVMKVNPVAISFSGSAIKSERQTTYVRFRWGGPIDDTTTTVAWMILNGYNWNATGTDGTVGVGWGVGVSYRQNVDPCQGWLSFMVPPTSAILNWDISIERGVWYDMFVTIEPSPSDPTKAQVNISVLKKNGPEKVGGEVVYSIPSVQTHKQIDKFKKPTYSDSHSSLRLGAESHADTYQSTTYNYGGYAKAFRGEIAKLMTWNRVLEDEERWQVMSGCWGSTFNLGLANGNADEFASGSEGESAWTPGDSWAGVRRTLTEENPSLLIQYAIPQRESGIGKILHVKPVDADAPLPVELYVNGESLGTYDLRFPASRAMFIPGEKWRNAADGKVRIEIARKAPFGALLEIDAATLCGGWRMDETVAQMTREGYIRSRHYIGSDDPRTVQRATTVQAANSRPCVSFSAWIPDEALSMFRHAFSVKIRGGNNDVPHAFLVNGRKFAEFYSSREKEVLSAAVPPGYLKAGENVFAVSNCVDSASGTKWARYSEYVIEVKRAYGLSVVLR